MWGAGQKVPEGRCEVSELTLLPWMWGQWVSATAAYGTALPNLVTSHPHCKLKLVSQLIGILQWLQRMILCLFYQEHMWTAIYSGNEGENIKNVEKSQMIWEADGRRNVTQERERRNAFVSPLFSTFLVWANSLFLHVLWGSHIRITFPEILANTMLPALPERRRGDLSTL